MDDHKELVARLRARYDLAPLGVPIAEDIPIRAADAIERLEKERDEARADADRYKRLDSEAANHVETLIVMRTGFNGEHPYVGWEGLGLALREALDERDELRAENERLRADLLANSESMAACGGCGTN